MDVLRVGTANLWDRGKGNRRWDEGLRERYELQERVLAAQDVDVWAVQELVAPSVHGAARLLVELAETCGLDCWVTRPQVVDEGGEVGQVAVAEAVTGYHVGLMWRPGIEVVPGSWQAVGRTAGLFHALASVVLEAGGRRVRVGSFHANPFDPQWRLGEARQVLRIMTYDGQPGLIGGDWNSLPASRASGEAGPGWYDPDVYATGEWFPQMTEQLEFGADPRRGDRRADQLLLEAGRLCDAAVVAGVPYTPTTGHHETDPHPPRRPDRVYGTWHFAADGGFTSCRVVDSADALATSDHAPVVVEAVLDRAEPLSSGD